MPSDLHALPSCQVLINLELGFLNLGLHPAHFTVEVDILGSGVVLEIS